MNKFGESIYGVNTSQIIKHVDAQIRISDANNESKFINETGDMITCLKIIDDPLDLNDAVNLKYIKQLEYKLQSHELIFTKLLKIDKSEIDKVYLQYKAERLNNKEINDKIKNLTVR